MTSVTLSNSPVFSLSRVWAFGIFYFPRLKKQLIIYGIASLVCAVLTILPVREEAQMAIFMSVWALLPILFYCGPLVFAKGADTRMLERLMPISAAERLTFFYLYILVVVPLVVFLLPLGAIWIYLSSPSLQTPDVISLYDLKFHSGLIGVINGIGGALIVMAALFCVEYARHNRMLFGIVGIIVGNIFIGILGGIIGFATTLRSFNQGFMDGWNGNPYNSQEAARKLMAMAMEDVGSVNALTLSITGIIVVMTVMTGWLTYRTIRNRNL